MNRRTFFRAIAPVAALAAPAFAQVGNESTAKSGRPNIDRKPAPGANDKAARKAKGQTEISAREGAFDNSDYKAVFTVEVEVTDPQFHLTCDKLTAFLKKPKAKADAPGLRQPIAAGTPAAAVEKNESSLERAEALGNVIIVQEKLDANGKLQRNVAKAHRATFDAISGIMKLHGWPQVMQTLNGVPEKHMFAAEEKCVITITREGELSYDIGRANLLVDSASISSSTPARRSNDR